MSNIAGADNSSEPILGDIEVGCRIFYDDDVFGNPFTSPCQCPECSLAPGPSYLPPPFDHPYIDQSSQNHTPGLLSLTRIDETLLEGTTLLDQQYAVAVKDWPCSPAPLPTQSQSSSQKPRPPAFKEVPSSSPFASGPENVCKRRIGRPSLSPAALANRRQRFMAEPYAVLIGDTDPGADKKTFKVRCILCDSVKGTPYWDWTPWQKHCESLKHIQADQAVEAQKRFFKNGAR